jgi:hypothetical protein
MLAVTNGLGVSDRKLKTQPAQIKRMIRAMLNAVAYIRLHRAEAVQRAMALYKFDAPTAEMAYDMLLKSLPAGGDSFRQSVRDSHKPEPGATRSAG